MPAKHIVIRKDSGTPSKPWCADVIHEDGTKWISWCSGFKTKKALVHHCDYFNVPVIFA